MKKISTKIQQNSSSKQDLQKDIEFENRLKSFYKDKYRFIAQKVVVSQEFCELLNGKIEISRPTVRLTKKIDVNQKIAILVPDLTNFKLFQKIKGLKKMIFKFISNFFYFPFVY